jgi:manganese transport protein
MFSLPKNATAPFCPPEVKGSVVIPPGASTWRKWLKYAGPGLLISVGYMDPGNWATDIEAGSKYGYDLLFAVLLSSLSAMLLQWLAMRLGVVTGRDLAQWARLRGSRKSILFQSQLATRCWYWASRARSSVNWKRLYWDLS